MGTSASREKFLHCTALLTTTSVSSSDSSFWDELWKLSTSSTTVFTCMSPEVCRSIIKNSNVLLLFTQAVAQLCQLVETPYNIYFEQGLNCARVLTRIVPFFMEIDGKDEKQRDAYDTIQGLCWGGDNRGDNSGDKSGDNSGNDGNDGNDGNSGNDSDKKTDSNDDEDRVPLAVLLVHSTMHMLFLPMFTVNCDINEEEDDEEDDWDGDGDGEEGSGEEGDSFRDSFNDSLNDSLNKSATEERQDDTDEGEEGARGASSPSFSSLARASPSQQSPSSAAALSNSSAISPHRQSMVWEYGPCLHPDPLSPCPPSGHAISSKSHVGGHVTVPNAGFYRNRVEVLRLLLSCCSEPLFKSSPADSPNLWLSVATSKDCPNVDILFHSLLNTVLGYDPNSSYLPYTSKLTGGPKLELVEISLQLLIVLLDSQPSDPASPNSYSLLLSSSTSPYFLSFSYLGFVRLLNCTHQSANTYLPGSMRDVQFYQEIIVLLWKFIDGNDAFRDYVVRDGNVTDVSFACFCFFHFIVTFHYFSFFLFCFFLTRYNPSIAKLVVPLCYLMFSSLSSGSSTGLIHICSFIFLNLSSSREFCISLNKPFRTHLPIDLPLFTGTHSDLLAITYHKVITSGNPGIRTLYGTFLTTICNISPYWRSLSLVAGMKIVNLFEIFTSPSRIHRGKPALVSSCVSHACTVLEILNNVVQYQFRGNEQLVYAIVRKKNSFRRVIDYDVQRAREEYGKVNKRAGKADGAQVNGEDRYAVGRWPVLFCFIFFRH